MNKAVYLFQEGDASMKSLLGGKGANLAEMTRIGLPVPPGFTITPQTCVAYLENQNQFPLHLMSEVQTALQTLEKQMGKLYGDAKNPLLLSVRSGAQVSMPGMMETILNLGLNDDTVQGLIAQTGNPRFAYDSYRRFIAMFGTVVFDIHKDAFENLLLAAKKRARVTADTDLRAKDLRDLVTAFKAVVHEKTGRAFPHDPTEQMVLAIEAVFKSWTIPRAVTYRNYHKISHSLGTAVNIQSMVFGNMGTDSATGVAFTRNPSTGQKELFGEYLVNAQGEDVVAGIRTPKNLSELSQEMPALYDAFSAITGRLEGHYKDVQDIEFTIEKGRLFMLQTRTGKRTVQAAAKIAVDMVEEGILTPAEAMLRVDASQVYQMLLPTFDLAAKATAKQENRLLASGISASPGAATGIIVFDPDEAETMAKAGEQVILVRPETNPDDVNGMIAAQGILTSRGGNTSHAAVVARGMGKPCIVGCESCSIDVAKGTLTANGVQLKQGAIISIDGATGEVFQGVIQTVPPHSSPEFEKLMTWADDARRLGVRANADTPADALKARELGAEGIGLCRTEHMFMDPTHLPVVQQMILAESAEVRKAMLAQLLPMQQQDFKEILAAMAGFPVTIRLLDPPLHEFLPNHDMLLEEVVTLVCRNKTGPELTERERVLRKVTELREANPMMGFRGCRIGLIYPEIYEMQMRAIFEAACQLQKEGVSVFPEVMIPLVGDVSELRRLRIALVAVADAVMQSHGVTVSYAFGTMIEIPRAALTADEIAEEAEFFSFGTNDLTQMTYGFSRDDAEGKFLQKYMDQGILAENPFETLDQEGVGKLMRMACALGRAARPDLHLGLCGEHGGEPKSVVFCHQIGLDYVSCSPYRLPTARLAAAQATLQHPTPATSEARLCPMGA